jgi:hypothetical protein
LGLLTPFGVEPFRRGREKLGQAIAAFTARDTAMKPPESAGITEWPENAMRHSFVSYRLATQNAPQTALESGHDQAVSFAHYQELAAANQE